MIGVLIDNQRFVPESSVLEIDFKSKTLWYRHRDPYPADETWRLPFNEISVIEIKPKESWFDINFLSEHAEKDLSNDN